MKVYVIKRNDGTYYKRCIDSIIMFEKEISSAEFYLDKPRVEEIVHFIIKRKHLYNILPEELNIVEVQLMETTELAEHDKQVRKEVCEQIKDKMIMYGTKTIYNSNGDAIGTHECLSLNEIKNILDQI